MLSCSRFCSIGAPSSQQCICARSDQITEALLLDLKNKNWKIRNEALQKLVSILNDAKFVTPNIGDLPVALHARLTDSNKNLVGGGARSRFIVILHPGQTACMLYDIYCSRLQ